MTWNPEICFNLSYFKETLKSLRKTDDNIILKLNTTKVKSHHSCLQLLESISQSYLEREELINFCTEKVDRNLLTLRTNASATPTNSDLQTHLYAEEVKLRAIRNERVVEEIIRDRSYTVLKDRCRSLYLPSDYRTYRANLPTISSPSS